MDKGLILPDEYTEPLDLVNLGLRCTDCRSLHVIYQITEPGPGFPRGTYCYKCLLQRCGASHRIPYPIETELLNRLRVDLGLDQVKKWYVFT